MTHAYETFDLNLLRVFFAIWDLRSLTLAGNRLGVTQPAISQSLRRLRERFDDPLFVRASNRMLPTELAIRLYEPLDRAFSMITGVLQERASFEPMRTQRTFRVAMAEVAEIYALPRLVSKLGKAAPLARIDVVPLVPDTIISSMRSGEIDLAIGYLEDPGNDCIRTDILNDRFICMVRAGHPLRLTKLNRSNFGNLQFFYSRITAPIYQAVEQWLADHGARPRIALRGHVAVAPEIVRSSDLAALFPEALALRLHRAKDFRFLDLPFALPRIEVKAHCHVRFASDMGIRWMCNFFAESLKNDP